MKMMDVVMPGMGGIESTRHVLRAAVLSCGDDSSVGIQDVTSAGTGAVDETSSRPWWMTTLAFFCLATVVFLVPRDLLFPDTRNTEVWLGFEVHGIAALVTAPIHWIVFLFGAWGFWFRRRWVLPCAAVYVFYVALSHLIWSEASPNGRGWPAGIVQALAISVPGVLLYRASRQTRD
jgi:hypothetical protein